MASTQLLCGREAAQWFSSCYGRLVVRQRWDVCFDGFGLSVFYCYMPEFTRVLDAKSVVSKSAAEKFALAARPVLHKWWPDGIRCTR